MAKREKNPASDKTGNDTGISLLVLGIVSVIFDFGFRSSGSFWGLYRL